MSRPDLYFFDGLMGLRVSELVPLALCCNSFLGLAGYISCEPDNSTYILLAFLVLLFFPPE